MKKLINCKVFGNWGEAGWEYGVIIIELSGSFGTDLVIEWEDGRQQTVDIKDIVEIGEQTDIHFLGVYVDVKGKYLSTSTQTNKQGQKTVKSYTKPHINNYNTYDDVGKLQALTSCLVDAIMSLDLRGYGYNSLSLSEQKRAKTAFFTQLNKHSVSVTSSMLNRAKSLTWDTIASLLQEYIGMNNNDKKVCI